MRNTTTTVVIAAGVVLAAVIVTRTPAQQEVGESIGACCFPTGNCVEVLHSVCDAGGGTFIGSGIQCPSVGCLPPTPTVVSVSTETVELNSGIFNIRVTRVWSDGQIDTMSYGGESSHLGDCELFAPCPPVVIVPGSCPTDVNRDGDTGVQDFLTLLGGWGPCR